MNKKIISILLIVVLSLSLTFIVGCDDSTLAADYTQLQVDINPSVEFNLDKDSKVVSVTALNDDGGVLISGEAYVGLDLTEALDKYINAAIDTGYISAGLSEDENQISMSVTGDNVLAKNVASTAKQKIKEVIDNKEEIKAKINSAVTATVDEIKAKLEECGYTAEELKDLAEKDLINKLAEEREETKEFVTTELRELYYKLKDNKINMAESESINTFLSNSKDVALRLSGAGYQLQYKIYEAAMNALDAAYYNLIVKDGSAYEKCLDAVREQKALVLEARNDLAGLDEASNEYTIKKKVLDSAEDLLTKAETKLEEAKEDVTIAIEELKEKLESSKGTLDEKYNDLLSKISETDVNEILTNTDEKLNSIKDNFFTEFETNYKEDIENKIKELQDQREKLIAQIKTQE